MHHQGVLSDLAGANAILQVIYQLAYCHLSYPPPYT